MYNPITYSVVTVVATYRDAEGVLHDVKHQVYNCTFVAGFGLISQIMMTVEEKRNWTLTATVAKLTV